MDLELDLILFLGLPFDLEFNSVLDLELDFNLKLILEFNLNLKRGIHMNNKQDCFELEEEAWSLGEYLKFRIASAFGKRGKSHGFTFESEFTNNFENVDYSESNVDDVEIII